MLHLEIRREIWPIAGRFVIARGARTSVETLVVKLTDAEGRQGRGECVPYKRYGETPESVAAQIEALRPALAAGLDRAGLQKALPPGAARNALDCAFWDLEAKGAGRPVWALAGLEAPAPLITAYTLSLETPEEMRRAAEKAAARPLLKIKLGGDDADLERVAAVRAGAPGARLIIDANESWSPELYTRLAPEMARLGVAAIEQPLPAGSDAALKALPRLVAVYADESCHDRASLVGLIGLYDGINIKLDKAGGLTEALALKAEAEAAGMKIMVGCMLAGSLAMAPAMLVAQGAELVDLDGPLLLARDREGGLRYEGSLVAPADEAFWG